MVQYRRGFHSASAQQEICKSSKLGNLIVDEDLGRYNTNQIEHPDLL
jgi:hypothetical protein